MAKDNIADFSKLVAWLQKATPKQIETAKSATQADLEVLQIYTSLDNGVEETVPSAGEINTGAPVAAHGADASTQIARHAQLAGQEGRMKDYEDLDGRLSGLEKAMGALVNLLTKANEDEIKANKDEDEEVGKSLRKARIAVRKAESCDDDECDENMGKAEVALKAAADMVSKAEDEAEDDEGEKKAEKARADLAALKGKFKALKVAKATPPVATVVKSEDEKEEEAKKAQEVALASFAASKGMTVAEMLERLSNPMATPTAASLNMPPNFAKSAGASVTTFIQRADSMRKAGTINDNEHQRLEMVIGKVNAMNANLLSETVVQQSIAELPTKLQSVFVPVAA
jgi:hypothetical protein